MQRFACINLPALCPIPGRGGVAWPRGGPGQGPPRGFEVGLSEPNLTLLACIDPPPLRLSSGRRSREFARLNSWPVLGPISGREGGVEAKGKGHLETYWVSSLRQARSESPQRPPRPP